MGEMLFLKRLPQFSRHLKEMLLMACRCSCISLFPKTQGGLWGILITINDSSRLYMNYLIVKTGTRFRLSKKVCLLAV